MQKHMREKQKPVLQSLKYRRQKWCSNVWAQWSTIFCRFLFDTLWNWYLLLLLEYTTYVLMLLFWVEWYCLLHWQKLENSKDNCSNIFLVQVLQVIWHLWSECLCQTAISPCNPESFFLTDIIHYWVLGLPQWFNSEALPITYQYAVMT